MGGAYFTFLYMLGLHGPEGFMLEVQEMIHHKDLRVVFFGHPWWVI